MRAGSKLSAEYKAVKHCPQSVHVLLLEEHGEDLNHILAKVWFFHGQMHITQPTICPLKCRHRPSSNRRLNHPWKPHHDTLTDLFGTKKRLQLETHVKRTVSLSLISAFKSHIEQDIFICEISWALCFVVFWWSNKAGSATKSPEYVTITENIFTKIALHSY